MFAQKIITLTSCSVVTAVDLKNAPGAVYSGEPKGEKAGCTLTLSDENFVGLVNGDLKPQQVRELYTYRVMGNFGSGLIW